MKKLLGYRWHYIDDNTRIEYGFHFGELDKTYRLQRKIKNKWKYTGAFTYPSTHVGSSLDVIINFLIFKESLHKKPEILF